MADSRSLKAPPTFVTRIIAAGRSRTSNGTPSKCDAPSPLVSSSRSCVKLMDMMRTISTLMAMAFAAVPAFAADLPVKQVVLYKHGVGYFERAGQLGPGESARLDFKAAEMNDVLKSLTIEEKGGGKITGLRYDSSETLEHKLQGFPFAVGDKQSLAA